MSSQFFGLEIGHTGLTAFQAAINTTANNISNVETPGYSKQKVNLEAQSALRVYQKYGSTSTGGYHKVEGYLLRSEILGESGELWLLRQA